MEARRLELLSEKDGYWSKRMAQDEARAAVLAAEVSESSLGYACATGTQMQLWLDLGVWLVHAAPAHD